MQRARHLIAWFCMAASLWMGTGLPLHNLSHALGMLEAARSHEGLPGTDTACDQCLLLAAADGAMPSTTAQVPLAPLTPHAPAPLSAAAVHTAFTAYASRAPPALG